MNQSWIFTVKNQSGIERQQLYGSKVAIFKNEKIVIGNKILTPAGVEYLLKDKFYEDDRYRIEQKEIIRSKHFPI